MFSIRTSIVPTCGQLSGPVNGALSLSSGVSEGSVATYTCNPGFTLTGSVTRTCTSDGGWTPAAPVCLRISKSCLYLYCSNLGLYFEMKIYLPTVDCGPLPSPPNGNVATPSGTTSGNVALYSCDEGLVLTGSTARVCGNDGLWTPTTPICEGQCTN